MGNTMGKYMRYIINIYIHRFITYKACPWYTYLGTCCQWPHSFLTFGAGPGRPKTRGFTILVFRHRSMLLKVQSGCVKFCAGKTESWPKLWGQMFISNPKLIFSYFFCLHTFFIHLTCSPANTIVTKMCNTSRTMLVNTSYILTQRALWPHGGRSVTVVVRRPSSLALAVVRVSTSSKHATHCLCVLLGQAWAK